MRTSRNYLSIISLGLLTIGLFLFPLFYAPIFTDAFVLPKQAILFIVTFVGLLLWGLRMLVDKKVVVRITPFSLPLMLFFIIILVSALIPYFQSNGNVKTTLLAAYPLLTLVLLYVVIVQTVDRKEDKRTLSLALLGGAALAALISVLSFLNIHVLPFQETKVASFTTLGNVLQSVLFALALLPKAGNKALAFFTKKDVKAFIFVPIATVLFLATILGAYQLTTTQKPLLLPQTIGLQTATGAIGQNFASLLFGSGPGTYISDFTRFKGAEFNALDFWTVRFLSSSSFALEILATMGLLGLLAFVFLAYRFIKSANVGLKEKRGAFLGILLLFVASLLLPLTFPLLALLFILLALYSAGTDDTQNVTLDVVALGKNGVSSVLPTLTFLLLFAIASFSLWQASAFLASDMRFQQSVVAARENKATDMYNKQREAIAIFPYRDGYLRTFSQTSILLANGVAQKGEDLTDQDRQTIVQLAQQSISTARSAVALYPLSVLNWENLAGIYRALIGFGENAENFAIESAQQAIRLDPANPQLYVFLGGIYYQLQQWDNAQNQFQIAANLKPDFANAHYNLGHALENKGDLKNALARYRAAETIISGLQENQQGVEENKKKLADEIAVLSKKIGDQEATASAQGQREPSDQQPPLSIDRPSTTLPPQEPPVPIPPPEATESAE